MLTKEQIQNNKERFKDLISAIGRLDDQQLHTVLTWFENSDFYVAPASVKYHGNYEGGLCEHCLNVYDNLKKLYDTFQFQLDEDDQDSLVIVALFHDLAKVNFYKKEIKHHKVSKPDGSSYWEDYTGYGYRDDKFVLGNHEENCAYLASTLLPLRLSEYSAILNHHGGQGWDSTKSGPGEMFAKYPIAIYLHMADTIDAYDERTRKTAI